MIHALLDALRRQQLEQYEEQKIYELDYRNPTVKDSDVLLINLLQNIWVFRKQSNWRLPAMPG